MIEILVALGLLTVFALLATRLFVASMRTIDQSSQRIDTLIRFDGMMRALRADVWSATAIDRVTENTLIVKTGDAGTVRWTIGPHGELTRTANGQAARTFTLPVSGANFAQLGAAVVVVVQEEPIVLPNLQELSRQ